MNIIIRQETEGDCEITQALVEKAFADVEYSDHKEHYLVDRLRKSDSFVPELSLVGEVDGVVVGHIMFPKILIKNNETEYESLALAPVSVLPEYQNRGIGSRLIIEGLKISKDLGFKSVIVLGHDKYYPRFGFKPARKWGIVAPFDVPEESFMALELQKNSLTEVTGTVVYPEEFFE